MDPSSPASRLIDLSTQDENIDAGTRVRLSTRTRQIVLFGVSLVIVLTVIGAHVVVATAGDEYSGGLAILDRIFDLLVAAGLAGASFFVGSAISRALSISYIGAAEELSFSVMLGAGALGLATLGLGLARLLSPGPVLLLLTGIVGLTARNGISRASGLLKATSTLRSSSQGRFIAGLFALIVGVLALRSLLPPTSFDELIYHLPVTKSFVDQGRVFPVYDSPEGNFPFLVHMIYALCIMAKSDIAARLFSLTMAVVTSIAIYAFCVRFLDRKAGVVAMFGFFGAGMVVEVAITSRVDVSLAGMLFAATYAVMVHLETRQLGWLYLSAILGGLAMGIKYDAGVWLFLVGVIYLVESISSRRLPVSTIIKRGVLCTMVAAAVASPWYLKNLVWFHNPIYWFMTGEARDTPPQPIAYFSNEDERKMDGYLDETRKEIPHTVELMTQELESWAARRVERHPLRVWDQFLHPGMFNVGEPYQDPNYLFMIAPLVLLLRKPRWLVWLLICCAAFFFIMGEVSWVGRYLLPVYPGMTIIAAFVLLEVSRKLRPYAPIARILPAIAVGVAVSSGIIVSASSIYSRNGVGFLDGSISRREFMLQFGYYAPIDTINHDLPPDARIMMLGAELGYGLKRDYLADPGWDATEWRRLLVHNNSFDEINQDLKRRGITHILLYPHQFRMVAGLGREGTGLNGMNRPEAGSQPADHPGSSINGEARPEYWSQLRTWATFELYGARYLEEIYADKYQFHLYRLK